MIRRRNTFRISFCQFEPASPRDTESVFWNLNSNRFGVNRYTNEQDQADLFTKLDGVRDQSMREVLVEFEEAVEPLRPKEKDVDAMSLKWQAEVKKNSWYFLNQLREEKRIAPDQPLTEEEHLSLLIEADDRLKKYKYLPNSFETTDQYPFQIRIRPLAFRSPSHPELRI